MNAMRIISPRVSPNVTSLYYHGGVVHVRRDGEAAAHPCEPSDLVAEGGSVGVQATTLVSRTADGPFEPLALALENDPPLRDAFARAVPVPSVGAWSNARFVVLALAVPSLAMLLELDRELVGKDLLGPGRLVVDLLLAAYVIFELTRRTPRMPAVAAAALLAVSMRWILVAVRLCGRGVHPAVWAAAALSVGTALTILARAPSRGRVALEIMGKLGISRSEVHSARAPLLPAPSGLAVGGAAAAAAGLPLILWLLRRGGAGPWPQAAAVVAYALIVPPLALRLANTADTRANAPANAAAAPSRISSRAMVRTLFAVALGLTLTAALLHGTHQFFDAGGELARCTGRLDDATRRLLAAEAAELSRRVASVRASTMLVMMTAAVMPLAEERIYRGVLMNVLVRRYGLTYGLFASAAAFGLAHVGIYELALYQTILLGLAFGLAYAEGGLIAAFLVHALWNLLNIA